MKDKKFLFIQPDNSFLIIPIIFLLTLGIIVVVNLIRDKSPTEKPAQPDYHNKHLITFEDANGKKLAD